MSQSDEANLTDVLHAINDSLRALTDAVQGLYAAQRDASRNALELTVTTEKVCSLIAENQKELAELLLRSFSDLSKKIDLISSGSSPFSGFPPSGGGKVQ
jgi:hypothetical protein